MTPIEQAAIAYVAARVRLVGADASTVLAYAVDVDEAWHALHVLTGHDAVVGCCDDDVEDLDVEAVSPDPDYL
jgi:hypothetical protein